MTEVLTEMTGLDFADFHQRYVLGPETLPVALEGDSIVVNFNSRIQLQDDLRRELDLNRSSTHRELTTTNGFVLIIDAGATKTKSRIQLTQLSTSPSEAEPVEKSLLYAEVRGEPQELSGKMSISYDTLEPLAEVHKLAVSRLNVSELGEQTWEVVPYDLSIRDNLITFDLQDGTFVFGVHPDSVLLLSPQITSSSPGSSIVIVSGDSLEFLVDAKVVGGENLSYLWSFGITPIESLESDDGSRASVVFLDPGRFEVSAVISDGITQTVNTWLVEVISGSLDGDFDNDGSVSFSDFILFAGAFGTESELYDIDHDGRVGFPDFLKFVANFGKSIFGQ